MSTIEQHKQLENNKLTTHDDGLPKFLSQKDWADYNSATSKANPSVLKDGSLEMSDPYHTCKKFDNPATKDGERKQFDNPAGKDTEFRKGAENPAGKDSEVRKGVDNPAGKDTELRKGFDNSAGKDSDLRKGFDNSADKDTGVRKGTDNPSVKDSIVNAPGKDGAPKEHGKPEGLKSKENIQFHPVEGEGNELYKSSRSSSAAPEISSTDNVTFASAQPVARPWTVNQDGTIKPGTSKSEPTG